MQNRTFLHIHLIIDQEGQQFDQAPPFDKIENFWICNFIKVGNQQPFLKLLVLLFVFYPYGSSSFSCQSTTNLTGQEEVLLFAIRQTYSIFNIVNIVNIVTGRYSLFHSLVVYTVNTQSSKNSHSLRTSSHTHTHTHTHTQTQLPGITATCSTRASET